MRPISSHGRKGMVFSMGTDLLCPERFVHNQTQPKEAVTADAGYWDTTSINDPSLAGIEMLVTPDAMHGGRRESQHKHNPTVERMRELLRQPRQRSLYGMRKTIVGPVFGQIKQIRGFRQFALRGLAKVQAEWKLICLTHNLLKLYRHRWLPQLA